nr:hypothetical protein [uncultured Mediterranean phage uvMED]
MKEFNKKDFGLYKIGYIKYYYVCMNKDHLGHEEEYVMQEEEEGKYKHFDFDFTKPEKVPLHDYFDVALDREFSPDILYPYWHSSLEKQEK